MDDYEWKKTWWTAALLFVCLVTAIIIIVRIETQS